MDTRHAWSVEGDWLDDGTQYQREPKDKKRKRKRKEDARIKKAKTDKRHQKKHASGTPVTTDPERRKDTKLCGTVQTPKTKIVAGRQKEKRTPAASVVVPEQPMDVESDEEMPEGHIVISVPTTEDPIPPYDADKVLRHKIPANNCFDKFDHNAVNGLRKLQIYGKIQAIDNNKIVYAHLSTMREAGEAISSRLNIEDLLNGPLGKVLASPSLPAELQLSPSQKYVRFLLRPEEYVATGDRCIGDELENASEQLEYESGKNSSHLEQDTTFPRHEARLGKALVVVGLPNQIAKHLAPEHEYAKACDATIKSIIGGKEPDAFFDSATVRRQYKRGNDFPVLVGLETTKAVDGKMSDFTQTNLAPVMLTTPAEIQHHITVVFLNRLYRQGLLEFDPAPVDPSNMLYRLKNKMYKALSPTLRSILLMSRIFCPVCNGTFSPTTESRKCCGLELVDDSSFVIKTNKNKQVIDPASLREITYKKALVDRKNVLPDNITDVKQLPQYELASPEINRFEMHMRNDLKRKNQDKKTVALTLFVPTPFSREHPAPNEEHLVNARIYYEGKEHLVKMCATRVKYSLSCNRKLAFTVDRRQKDALVREFRGISDCLSVDGNADADKYNITIEFPGLQANKRLGIQTVDATGSVARHTYLDTIQFADRDKVTKRLPRESIAANMFSATNFWSIPSMEGKNNFTRYGPTMLSGVVANLSVAGGDLLERDESGWNSVNIISTMSFDLVQSIYESTTKRVNGLERKQHTLESREIDLLDDIKRELAEKNERLHETEEECEELRKELCRVKEEKEYWQKEAEQLKTLMDEWQKEAEQLKTLMDEKLGAVNEELGAMSNKLTTEREARKNLQAEVDALKRTVMSNNPTTEREARKALQAEVDALKRSSESLNKQLQAAQTKGSGKKQRNPWAFLANKSFEANLTNSPAEVWNFPYQGDEAPAFYHSNEQGRSNFDEILGTPTPVCA